MNKTTKVQAVFPATRKDGSEVKGTNDKGQEWKLFKVKCEDGEYYPVFNPTTDIQPGVEVFIEWTEKKEGEFVNKKNVKIRVIEASLPTVNIDEELPTEEIKGEELPF